MSSPFTVGFACFAARERGLRDAIAAADLASKAAHAAYLEDRSKRDAYISAVREADALALDLIQLGHRIAERLNQFKAAHDASEKAYLAYISAASDPSTPLAELEELEQQWGSTTYAYRAAL